MAKILISEPVAASGVELLRSFEGLEVDHFPDMTREELLASIGDYDGLVVRSATKVTAEVIEKGAKLQVIGRAGVGVDNVDVPRATQSGIIVMNTPGGNRFAVAELTVGLILASLRPIVDACVSVRAGLWEKKRFAGRELRGKTIGLIGFGRIGLEVARRLKPFDVTIIAYDPYLTAENNPSGGIVEPADLDTVIKTSDILSMHVPLTDSTRGLISQERIAQMKPGAILVNASRGGTVDEEALLKALDSGHLAGAATDVFSEEPPTDERLRNHPKLIATPHIGASTKEASEGVMTQLAEQVGGFFTKGQIINALNVPVGDAELVKKFRPYLDLVRRIGGIIAGVSSEAITRLEVETRGSLKEPSLFGLNLLIGFLEADSPDGVNMVNAHLRAEARGIETHETYVTRPGTIRDELTVHAVGAKGERWTICGALNIRKEPVLTAVNGFGLEIVPEHCLLFIRNEDVPGVIGQIGTFLGGASINIEEMRLAKKADDPMPFAILKLGSALPPERLDEFRKLAFVAEARLADLGDHGSPA
jgi:D-3-phosphoglycerate dehydrogenase